MYQIKTIEIKKIFILLLFNIFQLSGIYADTSDSVDIINGVVVDDFTSETLPLVTIRTIPGYKGSITDLDGKFTISALHSDSLSFIVSGYVPRTLGIEDIIGEDYIIRLQPNSRRLAEVTVKGKRPKYSKKNNPAYDLMKRVRKDAPNLNPLSQSNYGYNYYNKISLGLNGIEAPEKGKMAFLREYTDSSIISGNPITLLSIKERAGEFKSINNTSINLVLGERSEGIDGGFEKENIRKMLDDALRDININDNDIILLQNRFVSPISRIADNFYHYYITDTIVNPTGEKLIELSFTPSNYESFGFNGKMWIGSKDSLCFVDSIEMRIPKATNINYVNNLLIRQKFHLDNSNYLHKEKDDMSLEIQLIPGTPVFYGRKISLFSDFDSNPDENFSNDKKREFFQLDNGEFMLAEATARNEEFWGNARLVPLTTAEEKMGSLLGRLRRMPWFYWGEKILSILVAGYWEPKPNFPIAFGPVNTLISYNDVEGVRLRVGGMTTAALSQHFFARGYGAYGFHDNRWKYSAEMEYSLIPKNKHAKEFPVNSFKLLHKYDVDFLGQHYPFTNSDNVFLSLKREGSYPATYLRTSQFEYKHEYYNNFSFTIGVENNIMYDSRNVRFVNGFGERINHFSQTSLYLTLRWAPGEKFIQGKTMRAPVNMDAPVFQLSHKYGPRRLFDSFYEMNCTELSVFKRFWFSAFGYMDVTLNAGYMWSKVPFPALLWQNANLSYTIQPESFSLMNPMEFATDKYVAVHLTYWANGALFNLIPGFKRLKLREVVTFKGVTGGLSAKNNPYLNPKELQYPAGIHPQKMSGTPYMEAGIGIDNILTFLRIDYIWRLTYLNSLDVDKSGLRISLHFSF